MSYLKRENEGKMINQKNLLFFSLLLLTIIGLVTIISGSPETIHANSDETANTASSWENAHQQISAVGAPYAISPSIAASPDGKTVLVVYSSAIAVDSPQNLYYSFSTKNGQSGSWTKHQPLNNSSATSSKAHVTFDQNNRAHVVWTEGTSIAYAKSVSSNLNDGFGNITIFPNIVGTAPEAATPKVVTYGNHVHIVWAEGKGDFDDPDPDIYHRHSTNGGSSWGTTLNTPNAITTDGVIETDGLSHKNPTVTVDNDGNLHVLYEKPGIFGILTREQIRYVKGKLSNDAIIWPLDESTHPIITADMSGNDPNEDPNFEVVEPDIIYVNGRLETSVTQKSVHTSIPSQKYQNIFNISCVGSCENESNWSSTQISDRIYYLDAEPYSLTSSIIRLGGCLNIAFDGKVLTGSEQIFLGNSCSGWGISTELTGNDESSRTIQPAAASQNNWWGYVVYEEFVGDAVDANKQVFFTRNRPAVYLPMIIKR